MSGKRVTMQQVAERAGVSRTTVSFVLNNTPNVNISPETRARILKAAHELNYARDFAATSLATGRSHTIAFVLRQDPDALLADAFLGSFLHGVSKAIAFNDYHLLFYTLSPAAPQGAYGELIRSQRVDGLLVSGPVIDDPELQALYAEGVPIVVQGTPDIPGMVSVDVDNIASARAATEHLIELGHRDIAHITNGPLTYTSSRDRLLGYRQALENAGIAFDSHLVAYGRFTCSSGFDAMSRLLKGPLPFSAAFVASDVVALGAIQAIRKRGLRIPEDISIIGFDDIPFIDYLDPGLTTIHLPITAIGFRAGETLMKLIKAEAIPENQVRLHTRLVLRGSTAAPNSSLSSQ